VKIHVASETMYMVKGNGVHTAFIDHLELLREQNQFEFVVNNDGFGDIFHSHTYGLYYFLKGMGYKNRRILTVHVIPDSIKGSLPFYKVFMPFVKWYFKQVYSYADVCIAISPEVENAIRKLNAKTNIVRIYNPIHIEKWKRTDENRSKGRQLLGLSDSDFVLLGVGQLQARKGVEDFMDVAQAIPNAKFVWAGGRPFKALTEGVLRIDSRIAQASDNIQFTGMLDLELMPLIYAAADAMLFTSYQENCPLAPIEAAACGMPVVFRDIMEYELLYEKSYLKAKSTEEFINDTQRLMNDKRYYEQGKQMSDTLLQQFDKNVVRQKLLNLYQNLVERSTEDFTPYLA